jgi:hypothetical protein
MLSSEKCPNVLQVTSREGMLQRLKESEVCTRLSSYHVNAFGTIVILFKISLVLLYFVQKEQVLQVIN